MGDNCKQSITYLISPAELVQKKHALYIDHLINEKNLHPIHGVAELIKELYENNFKLIIASSSPVEVIDAILKKFDFSNYFIATISGTQLVHSKPHPEIFLRPRTLQIVNPKNVL